MKEFYTRWIVIALAIILGWIAASLLKCNFDDSPYCYVGEKCSPEGSTIRWEEAGFHCVDCIKCNEGYWEEMNCEDY